jgi:asparagine synthase (glutamine-hydrolysing)
MNPKFDEPYLRLQYRRGVITHEGSLSYSRGLQTRVPPERDSPFFAWRWDGHTLVIENDRYGFYPLFYYAGQTEFLISASLLTLLRKGAPTEFDWPALAVFLRLGNYVGLDTPYRYIRLVPPSARVHRNGDQFCIAGLRPRISSDQTLTRQAAIDGYIELFRKAVAEMPAEHGAVVPLSGGRDSRHIFLELHRQKIGRLSALTVMYEPHLRTEDVAIARELTEATCTQHFMVNVPMNTVTLERRKNFLTNLTTFEHRWILPAIDSIQALDTVYEGVGGDTLSTAWGFDRDRLECLEKGNVQRLAQSYLGEDGYLPHALTQDALRNCSRDAARERLAHELKEHMDAANPLGSFHFWNRTRRVTALPPCCIWNQVSSVWCPYLHHQVFDFLSSIPARVLSHKEYHRFHTDAILTAYPEFAHVPFAGKAPAMRPARLFNLIGALQLLRYELQHPVGTLLRSAFLEPRIVRALVDPSYVSSVSSFLPLSLYLRQLEYSAAGRFEEV